MDDEIVLVSFKRSRFMSDSYSLDSNYDFMDNKNTS